MSTKLIYFAGSIRAGRDDANLYARIVKILKKYGTVLTEHVGNVNFTEKGKLGLNYLQERPLRYTSPLTKEPFTGFLGEGTTVLLALLSHSGTILGHVEVDIRPFLPVWLARVGRLGMLPQNWSLRWILVQFRQFRQPRSAATDFLVV